MKPRSLIRFSGRAADFMRGAAGLARDAELAAASAVSREERQAWERVALKFTEVVEALVERRKAAGA